MSTIDPRSPSINENVPFSIDDEDPSLALEELIEYDDYSNPGIIGDRKNEPVLGTQE